MKNIVCIQLMKTLPVMFIFLTGAGCMGELRAQGIAYQYDAAGNRTVRRNVIIMRKAMDANTGNTATAGNLSEAPSVVNKYEEDLQGEMKITIYPNPTDGFLRIDIRCDSPVPPQSQIQLYNAKGVIVKQLSGLSPSNELDISGQPAGIYLMRIALDKDHVSTWKIIKN